MLIQVEFLSSCTPFRYNLTSFQDGYINSIIFFIIIVTFTLFNYDDVKYKRITLRLRYYLSVAMLAAFKLSIHHLLQLKL